MIRRLCKLNRPKIAEYSGQINRIVCQPNFMCRSCARVADDGRYLCHPVAVCPSQPPHDNTGKVGCLDQDKKSNKKRVKKLRKMLKQQTKLAKKIEKYRKKLG